MSSEKKPAVYIVDGARTPFLKLADKQNPLSAADLAVAVAGPLLARQSFKPSDIEQVIAGCVGVPIEEANIGRLIALRLGCGEATTGWTVQRNCASGLQALESAALDIRSGHYDLVLAGGTECMSRSPILYSQSLTQWLMEMNARASVRQKIKTLLKFRLHFLKGVVALLKGLTDPLINLSMGQTAENLAYRFKITRAEMDAYAVQSHQRARDAVKNGLLEEIVPLFDWQGGVKVVDNGIREDSSVEKLATLKPVFDKPFGMVTAGNSSQISDGAAFLILASEAAVKRYQLPVLGKIVETAWSGLDPAVMGLGPVYAMQKLLAAQELSVQEIDYWEINEAFSAQMLACFKMMETETGLGALPLDKVNVDGGAIAIGHPVGATGARLVLHLLQVLKRNNAKRGIVSLCIGGGQGGALLIERDEEGY